MTKSLIIDPVQRTIYESDVSTREDFQRILPGGLCVAHVFATTGDVLYVDDEGLLRPPDCAFRLRIRQDGQPFMSFGIVQGRDMHEIDEFGELKEWTSDVRLTPENLRRYIQWLTVEEALRWFRLNRAFPAVTICSGNGPVTLETFGSLLKKMEGE